MKSIPSGPVCFVAMPWSLVSQPSIQIGVLAARLKAAGIGASGFYANLEFAERIGLKTYEANGDFHNLCSDWYFSQALFGDFQPPGGLAGGFLEFARKCGIAEDGIAEMISIQSQVSPFLEWCLKAVDWRSIQVVGFTTTMLQTVPSLALARHLKASFSHLKILFGGAGCQGVMGEAMHRNFSFVDGVIDGEADELVVDLVSRILHGDDPRILAGVRWRYADGRETYTPHAPAVRLDEYPTPDFDDFFDQFAGRPFTSSVQLRIPFEASRGCWWAVSRQCKFCGLNGEIVIQRVRPVAEVVRDLKHWRRRHGVSLFVATDNILAPAHTVSLPAALREEGLDIELFFEVRAVTSRRNLSALASAGIVHLQVGIESLVPEVLQMVDKGTTPILNLLFMRRAQELGVRYYWNLLYGFPGERVRWYHELMDWLPKVFHLAAPDLVRYSFQRFSPYFDDPARYNIRVTGPIPGTQYIWDLPAEQISALSYCLDFEVQGQEDERDMTHRLSEVVRRWASSKAVLLASCVAGGHVRILDSRSVASTSDYVLPWRESMLLRCLERPAALDEIRTRLVRHDQALYLRLGGSAGCRRAIGELSHRGLTFTEADRHLALVVPQTANFWVEVEKESGREQAARRELPLVQEVRLFRATLEVPGR